MSGRRARRSVDLRGHVSIPNGALYWVVIGPGVGVGPKSFNLAWVRKAIQRCQAAGVPVFVSHLGQTPYERLEDQQPAVDGWQTDERGKRWFKLKDRKGGSMEEWPVDLRVREYPT